MDVKSYNVNKINTQISLSGKSDDVMWTKADALTDFSSPWSSRPVKTIAFRALYDEKYFYFSYTVYDNQVYIDKKDDTKASIAQSDRVELFMRIDSKMSPYYCLEIDPTPRIMDFKAMPDREFDLNWSWPSSAIEVKSYQDGTCFIVEGKITLNSLKELNLLQEDDAGKYIEAGIFRAKYIQGVNGKYDPVWITWVNPNVSEPDFHIPSSFGILRFKN